MTLRFFVLQFGTYVCLVCYVFNRHLIFVEPTIIYLVGLSIQKEGKLVQNKIINDLTQAGASFTVCDGALQTPNLLKSKLLEGNLHE